MTGTVATSMSAFFRPSPPRGMIRSTYSRWVASSPSSARPPPPTSETDASGSPAAETASRTISVSTALECRALEEPRSTIALPLFRHRAAQSMVTFGRDS